MLADWKSICGRVPFVSFFASAMLCTEVDRIVRGGEPCLSFNPRMFRSTLRCLCPFRRTLQWVGSLQPFQKFEFP